MIVFSCLRNFICSSGLVIGGLLRGHHRPCAAAAVAAAEVATTTVTAAGVGTAALQALLSASAVRAGIAALLVVAESV